MSGVTAFQHVYVCQVISIFITIENRTLAIPLQLCTPILHSPPQLPQTCHSPGTHGTLLVKSLLFPLALSSTFCSNENPRLSQDVTSLADLTSSNWFPSLITGPGGGAGALPPTHCHTQTAVPAHLLKYWSLEARIIPLSRLHLQTSLGNSPLEKIRA